MQVPADYNKMTSDTIDTRMTNDEMDEDQRPGVQGEHCSGCDLEAYRWGGRNKSIERAASHEWNGNYKAKANEIE